MVRPLRSMQRTLFWASLQSIQAKPSGSQSSSCRAGVAAVEGVQVADPARQALVRGVAEELPGKALVVVPIVGLAELAAHEQELLARLGVHVAERSRRFANFCQASPGIRARSEPFVTDDVVVRQGKDVVFGEGVDHPEGELVMCLLPLAGGFAM